MLQNVENMPLKQSFPAVDPGDGMPDLPDSVIKDLSTDQYMLYLAWHSVKTGKLRPELLSPTPGPISHSRWLTLDLRKLLLYMTDHKLKGQNKKNLQLLVSFGMTNYIPMWFTIKKLGKLKYSSQILFKQIQLANQLKGPYAVIVQKNEVKLSWPACCVTLTLLPGL